MKHPCGVPLETLPGYWHVAHTRPRHEKALARDLLRADRAYFLPLIQKVTVIRRRWFRALVPLFSGYVFFKGNGTDAHDVLATNHVAAVLDVFDQAQLVSELVQIERALEQKASLQLYPSVRIGARFRVRCGPLAGLEGTVVRWQREPRLLLAVHMLGQSAAMEIDVALLEPVG